MKLSTAFTILSAGLLPGAKAQSIVDIVVGSADHTTLESLVLLTNLTGPLSGPNLTLFAPTDGAFAALPNTTVAKLLEAQWVFHLLDVLYYHVVPAVVPSSALSLGLEVTMLNGFATNITSLDPPMINDVDITVADLNATNGFVHVTDGVLLPPSVTTSLIEAAVATDELSTLVQVVTDAGLVTALSGGPFTVFAPLDSAFAAVDSATLAYLTSAAGVASLAEVLTYHVYPGILHSSQLVDGALTMLDTKSAMVNASAGTIAGAKIAQADILVNNGIIHIIESVMIPPNFTIPEGVTAAPATAPTPTGTTAPAPTPTGTSSSSIVGTSVALASAVATMFFL